MDSEPRKYEIAYIVASDVADDDVVRVAGIVTRVIEEAKGVVRLVSEPRKRRLFYPIKKQRNVHFGYTTFTADGSVPAEITKKLKFEKEILRSLITEEIPAASRHVSLRASWQPTEGVSGGRTPSAIQREEVEAISPEERQVAIENIDKRLEEILGT